MTNAQKAKMTGTVSQTIWPKAFSENGRLLPTNFSCADKYAIVILRNVKEIAPRKAYIAYFKFLRFIVNRGSSEIFPMNVSRTINAPEFRVIKNL